MKKTRKKGIRSLALLLALILAIGFSPVTNVEAKAAPRLNYKKVTLVQGKKKRLKVRNLSRRRRRKVKWYSTRKSVATVNRKGVVKAKRKGKAYIVAKVGRKKYLCKVIVKKKVRRKKKSKKPAGNTKRQLLTGSGSITLSRLSIPVIVGGKVNLLDYMNASAVNTLNKVSKSNRLKYYKWYSSSNSILTIDAKNFTAVGKKAGTAKIYCKYYTKNGRWCKSNTAKVIVGDAGDVKFSYSLSLEDSPFTNKNYKVWDFQHQESYDESLPKFNAITITIKNDSSKSVRLDRVELNTSTSQPTDIFFENPNFTSLTIPAHSMSTRVYYANYAYDFAGWECPKNYIIDKKVFKSVSLYYSYNGSRLRARSSNNSVYKITQNSYLTRKEWNEDDPYK